MKKKIISVLCLLLALIMSFALVGCDLFGGGGDNDDDGEKNPPTSTGMTKSDVESLAAAVVNVKMHNASFAFTDDSVYSITYTEDSGFDAMTVTCDLDTVAGYDKQSGNSYFNTRIEENEGEIFVGTVNVFNKRLDGDKYDQYVSVNNDVQNYKRYTSYLSASDIDENGYSEYFGMADVDLERYVESLEDVIEDYCCIDLDDITTANSVKSCAEALRDAFSAYVGYDGLFEIGTVSTATIESDVKSENEVKSYTLDLQQTSKVFWDNDEVTYAFDGTFTLKVRNNKLIEIASDLDIDMSMGTVLAGTASLSGKFTIEYEYDPSNEPSAAELATYTHTNPDLDDLPEPGPGPYPDEDDNEGNEGNGGNGGESNVPGGDNGNGGDSNVPDDNEGSNPDVDTPGTGTGNGNGDGDGGNIPSDPEELTPEQRLMNALSDVKNWDGGYSVDYTQEGTYTYDMSVHPDPTSAYLPEPVHFEHFVRDNHCFGYNPTNGNYYFLANFTDIVGSQDPIVNTTNVTTVKNTDGTYNQYVNCAYGTYGEFGTEWDSIFGYNNYADAADVRENGYCSEHDYYENYRDGRFYATSLNEDMGYIGLDLDGIANMITLEDWAEYLVNCFIVSSISQSYNVDNVTYNEAAAFPEQNGIAYRFGFAVNYSANFGSYVNDGSVTGTIRLTLEGDTLALITFETTSVESADDGTAVQSFRMEETKVYGLAYQYDSVRELTASDMEGYPSLAPGERPEYPGYFTGGEDMDAADYEKFATVVENTAAWNGSFTVIGNSETMKSLSETGSADDYVGLYYAEHDSTMAYSAENGNSIYAVDFVRGDNATYDNTSLSSYTLKQSDDTYNQYIDLIEDSYVDTVITREDRWTFYNNYATPDNVKNNGLNYPNYNGVTMSTYADSYTGLFDQYYNLDYNELIAAETGEDILTIYTNAYLEYVQASYPMTLDMETPTHYMYNLVTEGQNNEQYVFALYGTGTSFDGYATTQYEFMTEFIVNVCEGKIEYYEIYFTLEESSEIDGTLTLSKFEAETVMYIFYEYDSAYEPYSTAGYGSEPDPTMGGLAL